jgi:hypothetical protein
LSIIACCGGIAKLKQRPDAEQKRVAAQINAFLDSHNTTRTALGLPER